MDHSTMAVFTGNANPVLAQEIVRHLRQPLGRAYVGRFSDGETQVELMENVRGRDIFLVQSTCRFMLRTRYALLAGRPWTPLAAIYAQHLESPGTKAYSVGQARALFGAFSEVRIATRLSHGDLLSSAAGQRHQGALLSLARTIWPRRLLETFFPSLGLFMLIEAKK